jgi:hypothetical protein
MHGARRSIAMFALGALLFAGGVAYGAKGSEQINACSKKNNGTLYLPGDKGCRSGDSAVAWNIKGPAGASGPAGPAGATGPSGPPGASGTFSGSFKSPNGLYSVDVLDTGILLKGPGGSVKIDGGSVIVQGTAGAQLNAPIVSLNGGCTRVLRQNGTGSTPSSSVFTC